MSDPIRTFETGATRTADAGRVDPEGFLSPLAIDAFCEYMNKNRIQADGRIRDSDNWQKGIPFDSYMKSMWRHFFDVWSIHRGLSRNDAAGRRIEMREALCALMFNVQGYLHEEVKSEQQQA